VKIMKGSASIYGLVGAVLAATLSPALTFAQAGNAPIPAKQQPVAPEANPPGDIPDTQVFVDYKSSLGFALQVPEGWARSDLNDGLRFTDKYNTIDVTVSNAAQPTQAGITDAALATLKTQNRAVRIADVKNVNLPAGPAVLIAYSSNSEPNPVTNKQIRLENNRYIFFRDGKIVTLELSAPFGADNVDQWQFMAQHFSWS
jgi:hypothetical protein